MIFLASSRAIIDVVQIALQLLAASHCEFIKFDSKVLPDGTLGLFADEDKCGHHIGSTALHDDEFFKTGKIMIALSLAGAFCAGCLVLFEFLCCRVCCAVLLENLAYLGSAACGGLVYLVYLNVYCHDSLQEKAESTLENNGLKAKTGALLYECKFGEGSTYNLCAVCFYLAAMIVLCFSPKPTPLIRQLRK
jgi:hypothetical protein